MLFWIQVFALMIVAHLSALGLAALVISLYKRHQLTKTKIDRGNAAFEHLLAAQKTPPPNVTPFPKKVE